MQFSHMTLVPTWWYRTFYPPAANMSQTYWIKGNLLYSSCKNIFTQCSQIYSNSYLKKFSVDKFNHYRNKIPLNWLILTNESKWKWLHETMFTYKAWWEWLSLFTSGSHHTTVHNDGHRQWRGYQANDNTQPTKPVELTRLGSVLLLATSWNYV